MNMNDKVARHIAERILLAIGNRHEILDFLIDNSARGATSNILNKMWPPPKTQQ